MGPLDCPPKLTDLHGISPLAWQRRNHQHTQYRNCVDGMGYWGTVADCCIPAYPKTCSLASNLCARRHGFELQQSDSSEQFSPYSTGDIGPTSLISVDQLVGSASFTTKFNLVDKVEPMSLLCIKSYKKKRPQTEPMCQSH